MSVEKITDYYEWTLVCHVCGEIAGWVVVLNEEEMIKDGHSLDAGFVLEGKPIITRYIRGVRCRHCHTFIEVKGEEDVRVDQDTEG